MAAWTEAHKRAQAKYLKQTKTVCIRFKKDEEDLYDYVHNKPNTNGFIKELINKEKDKQKDTT